MIFIGNNPYLLQYYNNPSAAPCYCDVVLLPTDLILQGNFASLATSGYTVTVYVYSGDGFTQYEDATAYFEYYIFPFNSRVYFNLRAKTFSPQMCIHACYVLRVVISQGGTTYFDSFTERYCQNSCCDIPRGIEISQEGISHRPGDPEPTLPIPVETPYTPPSSDCGDRYITLRTTFDCYDAFTGDYYSIPTTIYQGSASWSFQKISNISARFAQRPRTVTRQISYNCNLERSESFKPYVLQSLNYSALFPTWKMNELEGMLHANHIYINDYINTEREYQFAGGVPFRQIYNCWELFKLDTEFQSCVVRQTFGCMPNCDLVNQMTFVIPFGNLQRMFYNENRVFIGSDLESISIWFLAQDGITSFVDVSGDYPNQYGAFTVTGTGYIPTYFYADYTTPPSKVYGNVNPDVISDAVACKVPVLGDMVITISTCQDPMIGTLIITTEPSSVETIYDYESWSLGGITDQVTISNGIALFYMESTNTTIPATGSPLTPPIFGNEIIGIVGVNARPSINVTLGHYNNPIIPLGSILTITTLGQLMWSGLPTTYDDTSSTITLNDIYYTL